MSLRSRKRSLRRNHPTRDLPSYKWVHPTLISNADTSIPIQHLTADGKTTSSDFPTTRTFNTGRLVEIYTTGYDGTLFVSGKSVTFTPILNCGAFTVEENKLYCVVPGIYEVRWNMNTLSYSALASEVHIKIETATDSAKCQRFLAGPSSSPFSEDRVTVYHHFTLAAGDYMTFTHVNYFDQMLGNVTLRHISD